MAALADVGGPPTACFSAEEIGDRIAIQFTPDGEGVKATWYIKNNPYKKVSRRALVNTIGFAAIGAGVGALISKFSKKNGANVSGKVIGIAAGTGGGIGFLLGSVAGTVKVRRKISQLRRADGVLAGVSRVDVDRICRAYLENHFAKNKRIFCGISKEIMAFPVRITDCRCKPIREQDRVRYEFSQLQQWARRKVECPQCRDPFQFKELEFCYETMEQIKTVTKEALRKLSETVNIDLTSDETVETILTENSIELARAFEDTKTIVAKIEDGSIEVVHACAIARFLKSGLQGYAVVVNGIADDIQTALAEQRTAGQLEPRHFAREVEVTEAWRKAFLPE